MALSQVSRKLQIELEKIEPTPAVEDTLGAYLKVKTNRLVLCPRDDIPAKATFPNAQIELITITQSRYLGVQVQKGVYAAAEALNVAIYFRTSRAKAHDSAAGDEFFCPGSLQSGGLFPKIASLPPRILCLLGRVATPGESAPPAVHWYTEDEFEDLEMAISGGGDGLDDKISGTSQPHHRLSSPGPAPGEAANKPALRIIVCLVGAGPPGPSEAGPGS